MEAGAGQTIRTRIPARMDRLPWSRWHWLVVAEQESLEDVAAPLSATSAEPA